MSKTFVEYNIDDIQVKNLQKQKAFWSNQDNLLAVSTFSSTAGGTVKLINENGLLQETSGSDLSVDIPFRTGSEVCTFAWHPKEMVLAIVWDNGDMGCFSIKKGKSKWTDVVEEDEDYSPHEHSKPLNAEWIDDGQGLVTVTSSGCIKVYSFDSMSASLTFINAHQMSDTITDYLVVKGPSKTSVLYIGASSGMLYQLNVSTVSVNDLVQLEHGVKKLLYYERKSRLVVVTDNLMLCQYSVSSSSPEVNEIVKVKLSSSAKSTESINILMIDESIGLIAICVTGERVVRLWQLETGHNAAVIVVESVDSHWAGLSSLAYCKDLLVAGTSNNHVIIWRRTSELEFSKVSQIQVKGNVAHISVSKNHQIACCTSLSELYLIDEQLMCSAFNENFAVAQIGAKTLKAFWLGESNNHCEVITETPIRFLTVSSNAKSLGVKTTGIKETYFYRILTNRIEFSKSISISEPLTCLVIYENTVYNLIVNPDESGKGNNSSVALSSFLIDEGNTNTSIYPLEMDRISSKSLNPHVVAFDLNSDNLLILLSCSGLYWYYVFRLKPTKAELINGPTKISSTEAFFNGKINCDGSLIALIESKSVAVIKSGQTELVRLGTAIDSSTAVLHWATNEPRFFCYKHENTLNIVICSMEDMTVKHYDQFYVPMETKFLGFQVPTLFLMEQGSTAKITKKSLSEFEGLSTATIKIMIDFLTSTTLDLNSMIKSIDQRGENNEKLWTNLARISVKCRDINMGLYCVSKLKNARVVKMVKKALAENASPDNALAVLAMNIGLNSEAEELLKSSPDSKLMLSKFYQAQNKWPEAIKCVDKLNQKTVYYDYAKYLEHEEGNLQEAVKYYEKSGTSVFEVPRMLFDVDGNSALETYCMKEAKTASEEERRRLVRWWGQYSESLGDINQALEAYEKAKDYYNLVRLLCYTGEADKAKAILQEAEERQESNPSKDAALLHIGRHEENNNPGESINYYLHCGAINHAIRVCKVNNRKNDLIKIVVNYGTRNEAKELVEKYVGSETNGREFGETNDEIHRESIAQLFFKAGYTDKAIQFCLEERLWITLRQLLEKIMAAAESEEESGEKIVISDETMRKSLEVLRADSDIVDIIIDLLLLRKDDKNIIQEIIVEYNVEVNERLIEKVEMVTKREPKKRLVQTLAEMSLKQGNYIIAAKLFNSIGDRLSAVKSLIRTGQNEKIISYANIARDKMVYKIAANYLQTASYSDDNLIAKFYKKANATQELERFLKERNLK